MKRIIAFCILSALCLTCLCSCDMGNGLIAELFGNGVGDYVPGDDVILVDPIEPYPDVQTNVGIDTEIWTEIYTDPPVEETWIEVDYAIPRLVKMGYLTMYLMYADGSTVELMNTEELKDWNSTLTVPAVPGATIVIKGFAWYNDGCDVGYSCSNPNYKSDVVDINWNEYSHVYGPVDADFLQGFYYELELDSLNIGYNGVCLYAFATEVQLDGYIMMHSLTVNLEAVEGDMTEGNVDDIYPMPPETAPADGN